MAVAYDNFTNGTATTSATLSWTHTIVAGAVQGLIIGVVINGSDESVSSVSIGGLSLTEVPLSPNVNTAGEDSTVSVWFLGNLTGILGFNITVTKSGSTRTVQGGCWSVTAGGTGLTEVVDTDNSILATSQANPSATLVLGGSTSFCCETFHSGQNAPSGITPLTSWLADLEHDFGTQNAGWYRYNTIASADVTMGWTQTADDANCIGIAVREVPAAAARRIFVT